MDIHPCNLARILFFGLWMIGNGIISIAAMQSSEDKLHPTAVIHYFYFDRFPIYPYKIEEIRRKPEWRYKFSGENMIELYKLLKRPGMRAAYPPGTTRLILDSNPWGPRALVGSEGHVKLGKQEYRLSDKDFAAVKHFIYARIPPSD